MAKSPLGHPVEVMWEDAIQSEEYFHPADAEKWQLPILYSYGICLRSDSKVIAIGMDVIPGGRLRDVKFIPRGMVRKVKILR